MPIAASIAAIKEQVSHAARAHGHAAPEIIAVSKGQPLDKIVEALAAGQRVFGENRVQEASSRWPDLKPVYPGIELHLIGPLQTNKVKDAVKLFDVIQTVDREKLARALGDEMRKQGRFLPCLVQVNTGEEPQKSGIPPGGLAALLSFCVRECGLNIKGLMCIPPAGEAPAPHFALLKRLAALHNLSHTSMGMSGDYEKAAALGASYLRIGSAIFGQR